ncbi:MAG: tRNA pseudouridine(13) synthase TruD [Planctomycetes bacterium]|nr:tRNA pseudouridine(13) synthase TruD [Planctomycetota bacterium]
MRIKSKPGDFRVFELLRAGYLADRGRFRVYRVTKRKLTSLEAAGELALAAGVKPSDVAMAGLKDRQGVTTQFMSVRGGRPVRFMTPSLKVETAGFAPQALTSRDSTGNGFEIVLRGVAASERAEIERELPDVRDNGVPNYYGDQRFGNLRHGQGWVAKELALGRHEDALWNLLAAPSENDNPRNRAFKRALASAWGEWKRCREVAGAFGQHHSIFEHLARDAEDFAGAFRYVKTEVRLIHLYAFQSHIWNRAVARFVGETAARGAKIVVPALEGPLSFARGPLPTPAEWKGTFRVPGEGLLDVEHADQRAWLTAALAAEGLAPEQFRIAGVPGFALKGEDRQLVIRPRGLEVVPDRRAQGVLRVRFDLPRGAYATLVLARLAPSRAAEEPEDSARRRAAGAASSGAPERAGTGGAAREEAPGQGRAGQRESRRGARGAARGGARRVPAVADPVAETPAAPPAPDERPAARPRAGAAARGGRPAGGRRGAPPERRRGR